MINSIKSTVKLKNAKTHHYIKSLVVEYLLPKTSFEIIEDCGQRYKMKFNNKWH